MFLIISEPSWIFIFVVHTPLSLVRIITTLNGCLDYSSESVVISEWLIDEGPNAYPWEFDRVVAGNEM